MTLAFFLVIVQAFLQIRRQLILSARVVVHEHLLKPCFTFVARAIVITIITSHFGDDVSVGGQDIRTVDCWAA